MHSLNGVLIYRLLKSTHFAFLEFYYMEALCLFFRQDNIRCGNKDFQNVFGNLFFIFSFFQAPRSPVLVGWGWLKQVWSKKHFSLIISRTMTPFTKEQSIGTVVTLRWNMILIDLSRKRKICITVIWTKDFTKCRTTWFGLPRWSPDPTTAYNAYWKRTFGFIYLRVEGFIDG